MKAIHLNLGGRLKLKSWMSHASNIFTTHLLIRNFSTNQVTIEEKEKKLERWVHLPSSNELWALHTKLWWDEWSNRISLQSRVLRLCKWCYFFFSHEENICCHSISLFDLGSVEIAKVVDRQRLNSEVSMIPHWSLNLVLKVETWWKQSKCKIRGLMSKKSLICTDSNLGVNLNMNCIYATISIQNEIHNGSIFEFKIREQIKSIDLPLWIFSK